jgi:hypothetical protein
VGLHIGTDETVKASLSRVRGRSLGELPSQVQIWSSIKVKLILQHLMNSIGGSSIVGNPEFGDLLLARITSRIWCDVHGTAMGVDMLLADIFYVHIMKTINDLIWIDLYSS